MLKIDHAGFLRVRFSNEPRELTLTHPFGFLTKSANKSLHGDHVTADFSPFRILLNQLERCGQVFESVVTDCVPLLGVEHLSSSSSSSSIRADQICTTQGVEVAYDSHGVRILNHERPLRKGLNRIGAAPPGSQIHIIIIIIIVMLADGSARLIVQELLRGVFPIVARAKSLSSLLLFGAETKFVFLVLLSLVVLLGE